MITVVDRSGQRMSLVKFMRREAAIECSEWQTFMVLYIAVGVILCVFILIAGCTTTPPVNETNDTRYTTPEYVTVNWGGDSGITRFVDTDADVMCWYVDSSDDGGLSCLPCNDVRGCYS